MCALTGVEQGLLDCTAKTIHSWSSIINQGADIDSLYNIISRNKSVISRWANTRQVLIVEAMSV